MVLDVKKIPIKIYLDIVESEDISTLRAMRKKYYGKAHTETRKAIDLRIENLQHRQN